MALWLKEGISEGGCKNLGKSEGQWKRFWMI